MAGTANDSAVYWKNGQMVRLSANGKATGIAVSANGDLYVSGVVDSSSGAQLAVYWKNGVQVNLTNCGPLDASDAAGLAVSGSDVYVAGFIISAGGDIDTAAIWKSGVLVPNLYTTEGNVFYSIVFNGSDMYVAGESGGYLKNGALVSLPQGFMITGLAFSGQNIYAIGSTSALPASGGFLPAYWKNGSLVTKFNDNVITNAIAATGNDVYIVGCIYPTVPGQPNAVYWKNGVQETLAPTGEINAITIIPN